jgi:uncharacterized protein with HEPN domain
MSVEKKWAFRIEHILEAIAKIQRYTQGMTEESFSADERTVDAVIRNFQVIGEATRYVPKAVQTRYREIPWSLMQGMRHVLVHGYNVVKLDVVWRTIQESLPPLIKPLQNILNENS